MWSQWVPNADAMRCDLARNESITWEYTPFYGPFGLLGGSHRAFELYKAFGTNLISLCFSRKGIKAGYLKLYGGPLTSLFCRPAA